MTRRGLAVVRYEVACEGDNTNFADPPLLHRGRSIVNEVLIDWAAKN